MKLSIITVNLNNKAGLQRTIDSVVSQSFRDFEWIIIDGGSVDGSRELIEKYSHYLSYHVCEPDNGIYNAMNKGAIMAKGEYLEFLNSGDVFAGADTLVNFFRKNRSEDIVFGNTLIKIDNKYKRVFYQNDYISCYRLTKTTIGHQSAIIKRSLFDALGRYDESYKIVSDWKFFFEAIVIHKCSVYHIDQDMIIYDTSGISSTNIELSKKERGKVLKHFLPEYAIDDYVSRFEVNELLNHRFSRIIIGILYRIIVRFENNGLLIKNHY